MQALNKLLNHDSLVGHPHLLGNALAKMLFRAIEDPAEGTLAHTFARRSLGITFFVKHWADEPADDQAHLPGLQAEEEGGLCLVPAHRVFRQTCSRIRFPVSFLVKYVRGLAIKKGYPHESKYNLHGK